MEPNINTKKPSKAKTIWLITIIFLFAVSNTAWGLFYYKQNQDNGSLNSKANNLSKSNDQLSSKVKKLNTEVSNLNEEIAKEKTETNEAWRVIPELGLKYKTTEETKPLTYVYTGPNSIGVSTTDRINAGSKDFANNHLNCTSQFTITKTDSSDIQEFKSSQSVTPKLIGKNIYTIQRSQNLPCNIDQATELSSAKIAGSLLDKLEPIN